jgi:hypothetical protein
MGLENLPPETTLEIENKLGFDEAMFVERGKTQDEKKKAVRRAFQILSNDLSK